MGIRETFTILGGARSSAIVPALLKALSESDQRIVAAAAGAVIEQRSPEGFLELLKRYDQFSPQVKESISQSLYRLRDMMPQFVKGAAGKIKRTLLDVLKSNTSVDTLPVLALYLEGEDEDNMQAEAAAAMAAVVSRFATERHEAESGARGAGYGAERIKLDLEVARRALHEAMDKLPDHRSPDIVRACCELGDEGHGILFDAIKHGGHAGQQRELILQMLRADDSLPAVEFIFALIGEKDEILRKIGVELLRARTSPEAVQGVLRAIVKLPQDTQRALIKVNHNIPWLPIIGPQINRLPKKYARFLFAETDKLEGSTETKAPLWAALAHASDTQIRDTAIEKLVASVTAQTRDAIAGLLKTGTEAVQLKVVEALAQSNPNDLTHVLAPCMSSEFESVRKAAGQAIARVGFNDYVQSFDKLDDKTRELAGRVFSELDEKHLNELISDLSHVDSRKRVQAIRILEATGNFRKVSKNMLELVNDSDKTVRATIIRFLVAVRNADAIKALMRLLSDKDSRVQANAVEAIEDVNQPQFRQVLVPFLRHPNNRVRGNACKALWKMGVKDVVPIVFAMLTDTNPKMRMTAAWVISEISPPEGAAKVANAISKEDDEDVLERLKKAERVLKEQHA